MRPDPRRHLTLLTRFLIGAGVLTLASLIVSVPTADDRGVVATETLRAVPTTVAPVDASPAPTPGTTTTVAATTEAPSTTIAQLEIFTATDIEVAVAPSVAFITTFNGSGSGVLVTDDILVTNAHVIWPFTTVGVLFPGDNRRPGRVVGIDPRADVAFIRVDSPRLPAPLPLGATDELDEGAALFVVGYPAAENFAPEPSVDVGPLRAVREWEFSGASWVHSGAAAIGGQSGGALVDEYGRLVGVTTFGSPSDLYSLSVEDVRDRLDQLAGEGLTSIDERRPPRLGGRRSLEVAFEGPWEQAAFVTWLSPGARSELTSDPAVAWRALDPFGVELGAGQGTLDVFWVLATPGVVLAESDGAATALVEVSRPLVPLDDPDDARQLEPGSGLTGFVDVPGDRDWFFYEVTAEGATVRIEVEAQTRVRITLYDRQTGAAVADVVHERGFFFEDPALVVEDVPAGSYVITVEDVGAQFGTYRIRVE